MWVYYLGCFDLRTFWKIVVTFAVLGLFVMVSALVVTLLVGGLSAPGFLGGDVAVVPIHGPIMMGGCPGGFLGGSSCANVEEIKGLLRQADDDPTVKAILLDIYSGGGNVVASRELMRAVKKTKKPTVAWIGEVGASGAYYVASAANYTIADENSITGSIGVIMFVEHYYDLFDWVGINVTTIKAGGSKDVLSPYRPMTDDEKGEMQNMIEKVYDSFVHDVAQNRRLDIDYVRNISQGRIYLGVEAKEIGLIDDTGGFDYAVEVAAEMGGIGGEPGVRRPEPKISLSDLLS
jgi:protease-4